MFIPLTISIFRGALSPIYLEEQHYIAGRLEQSTRQLKDLSGSLDTLTARLTAILADWHVSLPSLSFDFPSSSSSFSDFNITSALCSLRTEEMEYAISVSYGEARPTLFYYFYEALLKAEAHWLKLALREQIVLLRSDHDARLLLCRVLEEVYATGAEVDNACRRGLSADLCGQLKGALASLYLSLSIGFGYLLQTADYMSYRSLLSDVRYQHPVQERQALAYDILQAENQVKLLVSAEAPTDCESVALKLYDQLLMLCAALGQVSASDARLWRGVTALENYLFCLLNHLPLEKKNLYRLLTDNRWVSNSLNNLYAGQYAGHLHYNEARGASHWAFRKLNEQCLSFLKQLPSFNQSIPRQIQSYLLYQKKLYDRNYSRPFIPVQPGEQLTTMPVRSLGAKLPDEGEIHTLLAFLHTATDAKGARLMTSEHVDWLEYDFLSFLYSGQITAAHQHGVKIGKGYVEVIYGLFFHYRQVRGGDKLAYAQFLTSMLDVDVQPKNLVSNCKRYIEAYETMVSRTSFRLIS